ncbi:MAG TPA: PhzF family phenazine biosynthesis protein [Thermoanaerobaculia bacterium]|nr:PhzF family phenazine biosynthesis protein [Thermoanaerobaculia bacterium]
MPQPFIQVDSFTSEPYAGNPAAVCVLERERDDRWMQLVAREMNLAETAFLSRHGDEFSLRWFTPLAEVDLCGHATLAAAHVLWEEGILEPGAEIRFQTRSGLLIARRRSGYIEMNFPSEPATRADVPPGLAEALGATPLFVGRNRLDYLVELASPEEVLTVKPDFRALARIDVRGFIVTARTVGEDHHFISRYFAPAYGIDEDPVTGSSHCCLGPFWAARLERTEMVGFQASARGGIVHVRLEGERVMLSGHAVTVMRGVILH